MVLSVSILLHPCLYQTPSAWTLLFCDHRWLAVIALSADCHTAWQKVWLSNVVDIASTVPDVDQVDTNVFAPAWQRSFKQWRGAPNVVRLLPCGNSLFGLGVLLKRAKSSRWLLHIGFLHLHLATLSSCCSGKRIQSSASRKRRLCFANWFSARLFSCANFGHSEVGISQASTEETTTVPLSPSSILLVLPPPVPAGHIAEPCASQ